jgi:hypothetical protein
VGLVREVPLEAHLSQGQWYDTGYDDGIQYPLFEIAGPERVFFLEEVLYLANKEYGNNDDSSSEKRMHRIILIERDIMMRKPYKRVK